MPAQNSISCEKLAKLTGTPRCPLLVDVRSVADHAADPRLIPGAIHLDADDPDAVLAHLAGRAAVMICQHGHQRSQGLAAWARQAGPAAEFLEGGFLAWQQSGLPLTDPARLPRRRPDGRTVWVTRARPKIDRIACPWLIRRFVDPQAVFLFVAPTEVSRVAERFDAAAFDIEDTFWSHRGALCTFDVMLGEFGLQSPALNRLALIVRGADTARPDLAPESAGLLAASLGLSRMHTDDLDQLAAGLLLYDAFYRWARDATEETHNWPAAKAPA